MRLLFDNNLSPHLVSQLADVFPDASHVAQVGLERGDDEDVWKYARDGNYVIVTKDADFNDLSTLRGVPPKVVWLRVGNCPTPRIATLMRLHRAAIAAFASDGILVLA